VFPFSAFVGTIDGAHAATNGRQRHYQHNRDSGGGGWRQQDLPPPETATGARPDYDYFYGGDRGNGRSYYSYGTGFGGSSSATANVGDRMPAAAATTIKCYSCDYLKDLNHGQGMIGCLDPFEPGNIPTVDCAGPCAVSYSLMMNTSRGIQYTCV
jgi:hypothetical protein